MPSLLRSVRLKFLLVLLLTLFLSYQVFQNQSSELKVDHQANKLIEITETRTDEETVQSQNDYSPVIVDHVHFVNHDFKACFC